MRATQGWLGPPEVTLTYHPKSSLTKKFSSKRETGHARAMLVITCAAARGQHGWVDPATIPISYFGHSRTVE